YTIKREIVTIVNINTKINNLNSFVEKILLTLPLFSLNSSDVV
ncbi:unnamed protein product, partial [marine sediment metagenome]